MKIAVVALGKIGLPVAAHYAARGHHVTGCDTDPAAVAAVNRGANPIAHEPGLTESVRASVAEGRLHATTDTARGVADADAVIVLVPLDLDAGRRPDFGPMEAAFRAVAAGLRDGALVVLETTVPVGTCRGRLLPLLETAGRACGRDFFFAFSPERLQSGRIARDLATYPRVLGGIDAASGDKAEAFYRATHDVPVMRLSSAEAAEFCKLAESVYRDVNIALANELAGYAAAHGVDFHEVLPAANSQPQSHLHRPGLGVGGHCMPVYPYFLAGDAANADLTLTARRINDGMHRDAAARLAEALGGLAGRRVLILGLTYRPGVLETAYSPALALARLLRDGGAIVHGHDPLIDAAGVERLGLAPADLDAPLALDALVLSTADPAYATLDPRRFAGLRAVLDAPGMLDPAAISAAGATYLAIGRPAESPAAIGALR